MSGNEIRAKLNTHGDKIVMGIPVMSIIAFLIFATMRYLNTEGIVMADQKRLDKCSDKVDAMLMENTKDHADIKADIKYIVRVLREREDGKK